MLPWSVWLAAIAVAGPELSDRLQLTEVVGPPDVKVVRALGAHEELARRGASVFVGDEISVAPRQVVGLTAYDGSTWRLAPGTRFKAEARKPDPRTLSYWSFRLLRGSMWGLVKKAGENPPGKDGFRLKVLTASAALGIRGTEYLLSGDEARPAVDVLEGKVWWGTDPAFASGSYQEVNAGQHAELGAEGKISVRASVGDRAALQREYGLVVDGADPASKAGPARGTAQHCAALGLGWRSGDGSNGGECFREGETK